MQMTFGLIITAAATAASMGTLQASAHALSWDKSALASRVPPPSPPERSNGQQADAYRKDRSVRTPDLNRPPSTNGKSVNGIMTNGIMTNGVMVNGVRPIGEPVESILLIQGEEIHLR